MQHFWPGEHHAHPAQLRTARPTGRRHANAEGGWEMTLSFQTLPPQPNLRTNICNGFGALSSKTMAPEIDNIGAAIVKGVCNPEAKDLAVELANFEIGALLDADILQEIPIIKSVIACHKTWGAIHDRLFLQKVAKFILSSPKFTQQQKEQFIHDHLQDAQQAKQLSDAIVLILDKLDDFEKPQMVAKAFAAFVRNEIGLVIFRRLAAAIDIGFVDDLKEFSKLTDTSETVSTGANRSKSPSQFALYLNLVRTGLVGQKRGTGTVPITGVGYEITELGKSFIKLMNT
jgi:hypothetical protein